MAKKSSTPVKSASGKGSTTGTPSKLKLSPKKKIVSKPKGKTVKGNFTSEPEDAQVTESKPLKGKKLSLTVAKKGKALKEVAEEDITEVKQLIPAETIEMAINGLSTYISKNSKDSTKSQLFDEDKPDYYLQITTTKFLSSKPLSKPKSIALPYKLQDDDFKICLFVKDNVIDSDLLEQIEENKIPYLSKIITGKELKGEYKPFEAKRKLISEYDLFLSDDHLVPTLPKLLGKVFYDNATKFPIPIKVYAQNKFSIKTLTYSINKIVSSVTYIPPVGVNVSLKIGNADTDLDKLVANTQLITNGFKLNEGNKIRTVLLKTLDSPSLPLYYIDQIYSEDDIASEETKKPEPVARELDLDIEIPEGVKITEFEKGLLELAADPADVEKILSKKLKKAKKRSMETERDTKSKKSKKN